MMIDLKLEPIAEAVLRGAWGDELGQVTLEALLIEGYRTARLSTGDLATALGFETRFQAEEWLAGRGIALDYDLTDLDADRELLNRCLGPAHIQ